MNISVFGLGYVGCVSAACLAQDGHTVIGVDVDARKVTDIENARSPFFEPGLEALLAAGRASGKLSATTDEVSAIQQTDGALICVGTPSGKTGAVHLDALRAVLTSIGTALRDRTEPFVVILRSTVMPQAVEGELLPLLEKSAGKTIGATLQFCYNPEFLREGTAIRDFYEAPMIVIGHNHVQAASTLAEMYARVPAPIVYTDIATACMVKYVCNAFHALKVAFANEVGQLSESLHVDGRRVMEIMCMDTKLNISPMYLKPGFAFGGSCLPKDLRAMTAEGRRTGLPLPLVNSILSSNQNHLESSIRSVLEASDGPVGLLGLAFKEGTDDLRESPAVALAETLLGKGVDLTIYEPAISSKSIHGSNLNFVERTIPHIWKLLTPDLSKLLECKVVVLLRRISDREREALRELRADQTCIDLANNLQGDALRAKTIISGVGTPEEQLAAAK